MNTSAVRVTTVIAVVLVAVIAALVSFTHMQQLAYNAGEDWRSWLIPLSIDGLVVAASMVLLTRRRNGLPGGPLAWGALGAGVAASLAANMADARPEVTAVLVAGWPAVAFAVAFELLLQQRRADQVQLQDPAVQQPAVTPTSEPLPAATYQRVEPARPTRTPPPPSEAKSIDAEPVEVAVVPAEPDLVPRATANPPPPPSPDLDPLPAPTSSQVPDPDRSPGPDDDDLVTRVRQVIEDSTAAGSRPPGRRALAKQLDVSEHQVRVALELIGATTGPALNGTGAAEHAGHQSGGR